MQLIKHYKCRKIWSFTDIHQIYMFIQCKTKLIHIAQYFQVSTLSVRKQLYNYKLVFRQYGYIFKYLRILKIHHFSLSMHYINQILLRTGNTLLSYFDWIYLHKLLFGRSV